VLLGVEVGVWLGDAVGVLVGLAVGVDEGTAVLVEVGEADGVRVGVWDGLAVWLAERVGVALGLDDGVMAGVRLGDAVGLTVKVRVGVNEGVVVGPVETIASWPEARTGSSGSRSGPLRTWLTVTLNGKVPPGASARTSNTHSAITPCPAGTCFSPLASNRITASRGRSGQRTPSVGSICVRPALRMDCFSIRPHRAGSKSMLRSRPVMKSVVVALIGTTTAV
jgi:hypothetical protein